MKVGFHYYRPGHVSEFQAKQMEILKFNKIDTLMLDIGDEDFWDTVKDLDAFIFCFGHTSNHHQTVHRYMPVLERDMHIKCFPDLATGWHYDDKISQYYLFKSHALPYIPCHIFYDKQKAWEWAKRASYPTVFKLSRGAGSSNVRIVKSREEAKHYIRIMFGKGAKNCNLPGGALMRFKETPFTKYRVELAKTIYRYFTGQDTSQTWNTEKNYVLFQDFWDSNTFDTRITVIGGRAFAFRRFTRDDDFRASGSGKINYEMDKIDMKCVKTALEISEKLNFQSMAYDFIYSPQGKIGICEISYVFQDIAVHNCPGYWDKDLNWHAGHFWPQYFQLLDLLRIEELKIPAF